MDANNKAVVEGELLEGLALHPGWDVLLAKLQQKEQSLISKHAGIVESLDELNFDNGLRRGLREPLSIVQKAIEAKKRALAESQDA